MCFNVLDRIVEITSSDFKQNILVSASINCVTILSFIHSQFNLYHSFINLSVLHPITHQSTLTLHINPYTHINQHADWDTLIHNLSSINPSFYTYIRHTLLFLHIYYSIHWCASVHLHIIHALCTCLFIFTI